MRKPVVVLATLIIISAAALPSPALSQEAPGQRATPPAKISRFGEYQGYSAAVYDGSVRASRYLTMRDGVRLAADIVRPTLKGKVEEKPLPVIFTHTRYHRSNVDKEGKVEGEADSPFSQSLLKHGYVLAVVDVRGSGASFGTAQGLFSPDETRDAYEIIEWLAAQPWCDGRIGMFGGSYLGSTQLMAASAKPPHLKAIFPVVPPFDLYDVAYHNGVFFKDLVKTWSDLTVELDTSYPAAPVDEDRDGRLLKQALDEHRRNRPTIDIFTPLRFRDSRDALTGACLLRDWCPAGHVREIAQAKVPTYLWGGWYDSFTRDTVLLWKNVDAPRKLVMGAWSHSPRDPEILKDEFAPAGAEVMRWFDYWLKGIDNGIMAEPPIHYEVMKAPKVNEWRTAQTWPVPGARPTDFFLQAGTGADTSAGWGRRANANAGGLGLKAESGEGHDLYTVDYTTTTGTATRWDNAVGGGFGYPDMAANDAKGLTYTTAPLAGDVEVTGHPVVHLWVSSTAGDGDYFAYLEEVEASGVSHYVTEGAIKASYRAIGAAPYDFLGLPYHRSDAEDVAVPKAGEPVELVFDMPPTSNIFNAGNRIRLTITCADKDNAETVPVAPAPTVTVYRGGAKASRLVLPVVEVRDRDVRGHVRGRTKSTR